MDKLRPGAREESLRLIAEKMVSILARWRYGFFRKGAEHLIPNGALGNTSALGGDDAFGSQALSDVLVVGFRVELCIRQHQPNGRPSCRHVQQSGQRAHVGTWPLMRPLRQQNLLLHIHHNHPLQPMTMARTAIGMLFQAPYKEGADGIVGKPRAVNGHRNGSSPASAQPSHRFAQPPPHGDRVQPAPKTIQGGVVGYLSPISYRSQILG